MFGLFSDYGVPVCVFGSGFVFSESWVGESRVPFFFLEYDVARFFEFSHVFVGEVLASHGRDVRVVD